MPDPPGALPALAYLGGSEPMTRTPVVGQPAQDRPPVYVPGAESLAAGEIRVSVLGSGDPWIRRSQASGSLLIEVGNAEKDFFFLDLGSGSLANFTALMLPVEATTKVFLSHLHADHIGDIPGLIGSLAKAGRVDPVEIWGGGSEDPALGLAAFVEHMGKAMAWDTASVRGVRPTAGFAMTGHEIPYDRPATIYDRNGVTISCFPAIHGLSGAVGYAVGYAGLKVVFSGDTRPCKHVVEAAAGADLLIHECFQSPAVFARATGASPGDGVADHPPGAHGPGADGQDPGSGQAPDGSAVAPGHHPRRRCRLRGDQRQLHRAGDSDPGPDGLQRHPRRGHRPPGEGQRCRPARARTFADQPRTRSATGPPALVDRSTPRPVTRELARRPQQVLRPLPPLL